MIKFSDKVVPKNLQKSGTERIKSRRAANFGPKIGTVPLKVGQLVSMCYVLFCTDGTNCSQNDQVAFER